MEIKAQETLRDCEALEVSMTEDIEDMIFHIRAYYDVPEVLITTRYPCFRGESIPSVVEKYKKNELSMSKVIAYMDFLTEVEKQRAVERDIIFEYAKILTFGFRL